MEVGQRESRGRSTLSQINVTPFVDVMLVLLIIFMVTAPMMEKGIDVNLPQVENAPNLAAAQEPLIVTVQKGGSILIGRSRVDSPARLAPVLRQILEGRQEKEVFLEADRDVPYGEVVKVMAAMREAGVQKLGMVAEQPER